MNEKVFVSRKNHLIFIGFELFALGLVLFLYMHFRSKSVENISHYDYASAFLILFGAFTFFVGLSKRYFKLNDIELIFFNKKEKFRINYKDIYLVRLFQQGSSSQVILGIVRDNDEKEVFEISTAFFDAKVLHNLALELKEKSKTFNFLFEDEVDWLDQNSITEQKENQK